MNQQPLWTYSTYGEATSVATSSDGSYIAVGLQTSNAPTTGKVLLFNKAGSLLWARDSTTITSVAISDDGSHVAATGLVTKDITPGPYVTLQMNGTVYYFDQKGDELWNYSLPLHYVNFPGEWTPPNLRVMLSQDGARVVVDTGGGPVVFDSLGRMLWRYTPNCPGTVCPWLTLASANASFIVSISDEIRAFDSNGVSLWNSTSSPKPDLVNGVMSKDGKFILLEWENYWNPPNIQPTLTLLDRSGFNHWNRTLSDITAVLGMSSDDNVIVASPGGRMAAIDPQNRLLWNSTLSTGNLMTTSINGSYTAAIVALGLGHYALRILDGTGRAVWGYGDFGKVDELTLSNDDSFIAVAAGPEVNYSTNSAKVVFLAGPKTLANERGQTYAWFTFDPNSQNEPWLFAVPALFALVPPMYLLFKVLKESRTKNPQRERRG